MAREAIVKDYRSWGEYRAALETIDASVSVSGFGGRSWCGTDNVGEARGIADRGWAEGMARVRSISLPVVNQVTSTLAPDGGWGWDVTGAAYDVGEYLNGVPECWLAPVQVASRPCVTIAANIVTSGGIPKDMIELRGAAVVALTMALQTAGYAVRVYAVEGMLPRETGRTVWHRVCLTDDAGGPLDTDRLLFALAHPSAPRQLGYALGCVLAGAGPSGADIGWPHNDPGALPPEDWKADVYLPPPHYSDADWRNAESVSAWVRGQYEKLTGGAS